MADGHGHTVTAETDIIADPNQITGILVHITGTSSAGRGCGVIPVAFQTVIVPECDQHIGEITVVCTFRGVEFLPAGSGHIFLSFGILEHQAVVCVFVPAAGNVRDIPGVETCSLTDNEVFHS